MLLSLWLQETILPGDEFGPAKGKGGQEIQDLVLCTGGKRQEVSGARARTSSVCVWEWGWEAKGCLVRMEGVTLGQCSLVLGSKSGDSVR